MLHLRISSEPTDFDVEDEFDKILIDDRPIVRKIIKDIEQGEYLSPYYFCDKRRGNIEIWNLSTGSKAAILAALRPEMNINLIECGYNTIGFILKYMTEGHITVHPYICDWSIFRFGDYTNCDVELEGYRFTDISKLNEYLTEYWPNPLPYLYDGIEELEPHDLSFYEPFLNKPGFPPLGTRIEGV